MHRFLTACPKILVAGLIISGFYGCEEKYSEMGFDLLPDSDLYETKSIKLPVSAVTKSFDRVLTKQSNYILFGSLNMPMGGDFEPDLGKKRAEAALEFVPDFDTITALEIIQVDSIKLTINVQSYYGSGEVDQVLDIYELTSPLPEKDSLYSDIAEDLSYSPLLLNQTISGSVNTHIYELPVSFGENLLNPDKYTFDQIYHDTVGSNLKFIEEFPGLLFKTTQREGHGAILNIRLSQDATNATQSFITLYYTGRFARDTTGGNEPDTIAKAILVYNFDVFSDRKPTVYPADEITYSLPKRLSLFYHEDKETIVSKQNELNDSLIFLNSMGGTYSQLTIPGLTDWIGDQVVSVNYANLTFNVNKDKLTENYFVPPSVISIKGIDGGEEFKLPEATEQTAYLGGVYNQSAGTYSLSFSPYLNSILKGTENRKTELFNLFISNGGYDYENLLPHKVDLNVSDLEVEIIYTQKK